MTNPYSDLSEAVWFERDEPFDWWNDDPFDHWTYLVTDGAALR